jgi:hypothetical protein
MEAMGRSSSMRIAPDSRTESVPIARSSDLQRTASSSPILVPVTAMTFTIMRYGSSRCSKRFISTGTRNPEQFLAALQLSRDRLTALRDRRVDRRRGRQRCG